MIPSVLRKLDQWVLHDIDAKIPKQVYNPKFNASSTNKKTWAPYLNARQSCNGHGLGFVFSEHDDFCGIDLDNCIDDSGVIHESAQELLALLDSYSEYSPSKKGIHIWVRAVLRTDRHLTEGVPWGGKIEVYDRERYFRMTGDHVEGTPFQIKRRQDELDQVVVRFLGKKFNRRRPIKADEVGPGERYPALRSLMAGMFHRNMKSEEILERAYEFNGALENPLDSQRLNDLPRFMGWLEEQMADDEAKFWESSPILSHIREHAQAQRAAPGAVLCSVLARAVSMTSHKIVTPGRGAGAGVGSLNMFVALVGEPGKGKDVAISESRDAIELGDDDVAVMRLGSGEGLAHVYKDRDKSGEYWVRRSCFFIEPEVETVLSIGGRQGSTLISELRSSWNASALGHAWSDPKKRRSIPGHSYRMCLVAGVQPAKAGVILTDVAGGMPQRFIWTLCSDRYAPDVVDTSVYQMAVELGFDQQFADEDDQVVMPVCRRARLEIDKFAVGSLRGEFDEDSLYGHMLQCRLKLAAALAILHGERSVTDHWWFLSDWLVRRSEDARNVCSYYSWQENLKLIKRQGRAQGLISVEASSASSAVLFERCSQAVVRLLERGPSSRTKLSQGLANQALRAELDDVLANLERRGIVKSRMKSARANASRLYEIVGK